MLNNLGRKIGAYLGILSIVGSDVVAMQAERGLLQIRGRKNLQIIGRPQPLPMPTDISSLSYEDFDITAHLVDMPFPMGMRAWPSEKHKIKAQHLDINIPYVEGRNPVVDYDSLRAIPFFISTFLGDKIHPSKQTGAKDFFEKLIIPNQQTLSFDTQEIPDLDCLYYKPVSGSQHLFLRLSSATRKEAEIFKQRSNGKTLFVEKGELKLLSDGSITLDHVDAEADKITVEAKDTIFNRASKMKAKWIIRLKAGKQRNETVINKWIRESRGKHHFAHAEGVESIDDCSFIAKEVIQEGDEVENYGIFIEADKFEDRAIHTINMPAKITLINYAWEEDEDMFSSASSSVRQVDDVVVPTRYHVNYYRSASNVSGSLVKFGYTIINSGSKIEVLKDIKEDVVVDEQHTIEIHEEKSGFSICGGVSIPDPTSHLQKLRAMHKAGNMVGLTTATISAVAKGIQAYEDYKLAKALVDCAAPWELKETTALLQMLSHYVHGPSIQFGSRSVDTSQQTTLTHGNMFVAPTQIFHNSEISSFAGTYIAQDMSIKTKTFVTFDLPQTVHSEMTTHQSGVSMDLLSFAISLMNPAVGTALDAALGASSVTVGFQNGKSHQTIHKPTILQAERRLDIGAESGRLTQAQIKAGIVHAVFSNDLVLEILANERWERKRGKGLSLGLAGLANFETLAKSLKDTVVSASISNIDSGSFEKIIDDFAAMVGEEEFYLRVGGILQTNSAFLGHATHDPSKEHIEAKEIRDTKVEEYYESWDRGFDLAVSDFMSVINAFKQQIKDKAMSEALDEGLPMQQAVQIAEQKEQRFVQDFNEESKKIDETEEKIIKIGEKVKAKESATNEEKTNALVDGLKDIAKECAGLASQRRVDSDNIVKESSLQTRLDALNGEKQKYLIELAKIEQAEKVIRANEAVSSQQTLIWSELDDPTLVNPSSIKITNEAEVRRAAEERTAREFQRQRDIIEAEYRAQIRFSRGEGFSKPAPIAAPGGMPISIEKINSPENRLERLRQQELGKIGEDDVQRFARFIPVVGPAMDYHYDRISGREFAGILTIDTASTLALGGMQKAVAGSNASLHAQFQKILYARLNQAPYDPRAMEAMLKSRYGEANVISTTMSKAGAKNVKLAGKGKPVTIGIDELTGEPIIKHIPFNERGMPIFDDVAKVEVRISGDLSHMTSEAHRKAATRQLKADIDAGRVDRRLFSDLEWKQITAGKPKIGRHTWHHHEDTGRMQLLPEGINSDVGHIGGDKLWGMEKK